jgi:uncharacterized protein YkwD
MKHLLVRRLSPVVMLIYAVYGSFFGLFGCSADHKKGQNRSDQNHGTVQPADNFDPSSPVDPGNASTPNPADANPAEPVTPVVTEQPLEDCYKADAFICEVEKAIFVQTNEYRMQEGKTPLKLAKRISFVAREWSQSQARRGFIGHFGFPWMRESAFKKEFNSMDGVELWGENVAYTGMASDDDAASVAREFTEMWWNSSGHRQNMLGEHETIGVGVYKKGGSTYYATQIFGAGE